MNVSAIKKIFGKGLVLAIPFGVVVYVFIKLLGIFQKLVNPFAIRLGIERILSELTLTVFAVFLLLIFMFLLGLLMQFLRWRVLAKILKRCCLNFFHHCAI
jgi:uncharacterized membrane protein